MVGIEKHMPSSIHKLLPFRPVSLIGLLLMLALVTPASAITLLFQEDFESLTLGAPIDESFLASTFPEAFTHNQPSGWDRIASNIPGVGDPDVGVAEWEGWSFADREFWVAAASGPSGSPPGGREAFTLGQGTIAVADPDQWNDLGDPANEIGFYNSLLITPTIDLSPRRTDENHLVIQFDSSWRGGCCDDGESFDPDGNNQTAVLSARLPNNQLVEIFRWESAPFYDNQGNPTTDPIDVTGLSNMPNVFFKPDDFNERVTIDLGNLIPPSSFALVTEGPTDGSGTSASGEGVSFEFGMENAGDDGFWGFDNVEVVSYGDTLGDMDLSGALEQADIAAFALGMLDTDAYRFDYFGELPGTRGSPDSTFDFDDVPWFVSLLEGAGVASAAEALAFAFAPTVPEPGTLSLLMMGAISCLARRSRSPSR